MLNKLLITVAILGAAASVAGLGTYATFTSSAPVNQAAIATGTVAISIGAAGPTNRLTIGATGLLPGDTIQRAVDLVNSGNSNLASVTLTTSLLSASSVLDSDATNGLQMVIDSCSVAWTESGGPTNYTYACSGSTQTVLASTRVLGSNLALANLGSLTAGVTDHLHVTLTLPASADNTFQGKTSTFSYTFNATQRTPAAK